MININKVNEVLCNSETIYSVSMGVSKYLFFTHWRGSNALEDLRLRSNWKRGEMGAVCL